MRLLADIADLFLARACVGCDEPGPPLCELCTAELLPHAMAVPDLAHDLPRTSTGLPYAGLARRAVIAHKERGVRALTPPLGLLLAAAVRHLGEEAALVPVPSHPRSLRTRGRDTVLEIAQEAAGRLRLPVAPLLVRERGDRQKQRTAAERREGQGRAGVHLRRDPRSPLPLRVVLVDDVIATGATVGLCRDALSRSGITVAGIATATASLLQHGGRQLG